jgi:hypothetical protein
MPLIIIQSILAHVPVISTDIGQIKEMLQSKRGPVGVIIKADQDDKRFVKALTDKVRKAVMGKLKFDPRSFTLLEDKYSMEVCVDRYEELYGTRAIRPAIRRHGTV